MIDSTPINGKNYKATHIRGTHANTNEEDISRYNQTSHYEVSFSRA